MLKYRLAKEPGSTYTVEGTELADAQRAMRVIRSRATEWGVDPARVGVIGFSAGGELAALLSTRSDSSGGASEDAVDRMSSKPAFQGLVYPALSKEMALSKETPPAFLLCGANDREDISDGVADLYLKMKRAGTPVEVHILSGVGHGFGIRETNAANVVGWPDLFYRWLESSGFLKQR